MPGITLKCEKGYCRTCQQMEIKVITDPYQLATFGITETPAAVLAEYKVKSKGSNPSVKIIKEWVKTV